MIPERFAPHALLAMQVTAHIALVALIVMGRWDLLLLSLAVYCITGCVGMTVTYHRLLSHRSWKAPVWFERLGTLCGAYGLVGSSIAWVAIHREHHRHSDKPGDPHSPHLFPWWKVQWFSMFDPVNPRFAVDLARDSFHRVIHRWYLTTHLALIVVGLTTFPLLTMALYLAPAAILWNAGSAINTLNHLLGSRPSSTRDHSTNHWITGWFVFGEGWHNHHHAHPSDPQFGKRWWEVDAGWWVIRMVRKDDMP